MISEGSGIKADSIAIVNTIPGYPRVEMTLMIQFATLSSMLTIVPTPIGNLKDITLRAIEALQGVDAVICEDSRRTSILLNHFQINKPFIVFNDFNEYKMVSNIIQRLQSGQNLALVSDAGTPLISDPGFKLVRECLLSGIEVDSIPGPTAAITALTLSGLPPDKFLFLGYLPEKPGQRTQMLQKLTQVNNLLNTTFIAYIAPHKLVKTLTDMNDVFGDIEIVLASELTKMHHSVQKKLISLLIGELKNPKGEYTVVFRLNGTE